MTGGWSVEPYPVRLRVGGRDTTVAKAAAEDMPGWEVAVRADAAAPRGSSTAHVRELLDAYDAMAHHARTLEDALGRMAARPAGGVS